MTRVIIRAPGRILELRQVSRPYPGFPNVAALIRDPERSLEERGKNEPGAGDKQPDQ
jgi:hypothetical protein